jgi:hypothetical protein
MTDDQVSAVAIMAETVIGGRAMLRIIRSDWLAIQTFQPNTPPKKVPTASSMNIIRLVMDWIVAPIHHLYSHRNLTCEPQHRTEPPVGQYFERQAPKKSTNESHPQHKLR